MQKWALGLILVLALIAGMLYVFREDLYRFALGMQLRPDASFAEIEPPPAPDYASEDYWAALPTKGENADFTPLGHEDKQVEARVDVFYIHPTTYLSSEGWNQPQGDEEIHRDSRHRHPHNAGECLQRLLRRVCAKISPGDPV